MKLPYGYSDPTLPRRILILVLGLTAALYTFISVLDAIYSPQP